jgi:hypothetical protein
MNTVHDIERAVAAAATDLCARNILAVLDRATPEEWAEGANWYPAANSFAVGLAEKYGFRLWQTAAAIAALSPQVSWSRNVTMAEALCAGRPAGGQTGANIAKARAALRGEMTLGGPKVRAFFWNIYQPEAEDVVTIDRHAVAIAFGRPLGDVERIRALSTPRKYRTYAEAYQRAAKDVGMPANTLQAITWVRWRNEQRAGGPGTD